MYDGSITKVLLHLMLDLNPDVGLPGMWNHPGLWLHPMNRSPRPWKRFPTSLHPEEAGERKREDEDEEEDAKGENNPGWGKTELLVWTLRGARC